MSKSTKKKKGGKDDTTAAPPAIYTVFKTNKRAKQVYKEWCSSAATAAAASATSNAAATTIAPPKDGLSLQQFTHCIRTYLSNNYQANTLNDQITDAAIAALFDECVRLDSLKVESDPHVLTLQQFLTRLGVQSPSATTNTVAAPTQPLQSIQLSAEDDTTAVSPQQIATIVSQLYLGGVRQYASVDLVGAVQQLRQCKPSETRKLVNAVLSAEAEVAKAAARDTRQWAKKGLDRGGITVEEAQEFHRHLYEVIPLPQTRSGSRGSTSSSQKKRPTEAGPIDMSAVFEWSKTQAAPATADPSKKKGTGKKSSSSKKKKRAATANGTTDKKPGKKGDKNLIFAPYVTTHTLKSVKADNLHQWFTEVVYQHLRKTTSADYKCHPTLQHWNTNDQQLYGLHRGESGYQKPLLLSNHSRLKLVVKDGSDGRVGHDKVLAYGSLRLECTTLCYLEVLLSCCIVMNMDEVVQRVDIRVSRIWRDGDPESLRLYVPEHAAAECQDADQQLRSNVTYLSPLVSSNALPKSLVSDEHDLHHKFSQWTVAAGVEDNESEELSNSVAG